MRNLTIFLHSNLQSVFTVRFERNDLIITLSNYYLKLEAVENIKKKW